MGNVSFTSGQIDNSPLVVPVTLTIGAVIDSLVSAATFQLNGANAVGSIATIFGENLSALTIPATTPLPTKLGGVSVTVGGIDAPLYYVSPTQINLQLPYGLKPGINPFVLKSGGSTGNSTVRVAASAPGIFLIGKYGAAINPDGSVNGPEHGAPVGGYVSLYMTGQGDVDPPVAAGAVSPSDPLSYVKDQQVTALIGGLNAEVLFAGLAPGLVGALQVNLRVPDLPTGDYLVKVTIGSATSNAPLLRVVKQ